MQIKTKFSRWKTYIFTLGIGAIAVTISPVSSAAIPKQILQLPSLNLPQLNNLRATNRDENIDSTVVTLDGYRLFPIAAPATTDKNVKPIEQRVKTIENILNEIASSDFDPDALQVQTTIDQNSGLPVISVNDRYLMTVTTLDAQIQGSEPKRQANEFAKIIKNALLRAKQERESEFLIRQGAIAAVVFVGAISLSCVLANLQRYYKAQQKKIEAETPQDPIDTAEAPDRSNTPTTTIVQQQLSKQQERNLSDLKRRLLHLGQIGVWGGSTSAILSMFPYTRWLQPIVLSAPLQLLGVGVGTYILVRFGDLLIDRFFEVVEESDFLAPQTYQRRALRISTLSRVFKSATTLVGVSAGVLIALSVVGVDLLPLLAGAGIIGLAISFAAQSVIKDTINGLLILVEDQYAVGDVIAIDDVSGLVENINLRITQIRDSEGKLITIPNSAITIVQNLSKDWSRVDLAISVAYGTNPDRALDILRQLSQEMYADRYWRTQLIEAPEVLGIDAIDHSGILIRVWIKTQPLQQWLVAREFRRRLKLRMKEEGIEIGAPQQLLHFKDTLKLNNGRRENKITNE